MIQIVYIIYNPNSTGDAKDNAQDLKTHLDATSPGIPTKLLPTQKAGDAIGFGNQYAGEGVMLISSSGDGGFHELINGVLTSSYPQTIVGVLPSGNANDHWNSCHHGDLVERILAEDVDMHDVLALRWANETRYAHSYIGLGFTAHAGETITKERPNKLTEKLIVLRELFTKRPATIRTKHGLERYDNLIFSISGQMSKVLNMGDETSRPLGEFTIVRKPATTPLGLLRHFLKLAVTSTADDAPTGNTYTFTTLRPTKVQMDGEVITIPSNTEVHVTCMANGLTTII